MTFAAVDIAGNVGTGTSTLVVDNTAPTFSNVSVAGGQPYTYKPEVQAAVPGALTPLFYGVGTGSITVTTSVTDDLAGLDTVTFPNAAGKGASIPKRVRPTLACSMSMPLTLPPPLAARFRFRQVTEPATQLRRMSSCFRMRLRLHYT